MTLFRKHKKSVWARRTTLPTVQEKQLYHKAFYVHFFKILVRILMAGPFEAILKNCYFRDYCLSLIFLKAFVFKGSPMTAENLAPV